MKKNINMVKEAKCENCLYGRRIVVAAPESKNGEVIEMCTCHVSRPTTRGFPVVKTDDYCSFHVDQKGNKTFNGMTPSAATC